MVTVTRFGFIALLLCLSPYNVHAEFQCLATNKQYNQENIKPAEKSQNRSSVQ